MIENTVYGDPPHHVSDKIAGYTSVSRDLASVRGKCSAPGALVTWNARSLVMNRQHPKPAAAKARFFCNLLRRVDVGCFQEVRGAEDSFRAAFSLALIPFHVFGTFADNPNSGGTVTLIRALGSSFSDFVPTTLVEGRVIRVAYCPEGVCSSVVWNVHNHDLSDAAARLVARLIAEDTAWANDMPQMRSVIVAGDWNFLPPEEVRLSVSTPQPTPLIKDDYVGQQAKIFSQPLGKLIDVAPDVYTRYDASRHLVSRLDRIYVSLSS